MPVGVGRADDPAVPPGQDEEHALFGAQDEGALRVDAVLRHDQMDSLGRPHDHGIGDTGESLHLGCPHSGGIDHRAGTHVELTTGLEVLRVDTSDPVALVQEADDAERRNADRAARSRRSRQHERETGVVDLGVEVADATGQRVGAKGRHRPQARAAREVTVMRHGGMQPGEGVVEEQTRPHVEALPGPVLEREQEGCRMDQVGGDLLNQEAPFMQRLAHKLDVEVLEVAQTAVNQLAGAARGPGSEIPLFYERHRQAAAGRVQSGAAAGHATAYDEHVEGLGRQAFQGACTVGRPETCFSVQRHQTISLQARRFPSVNCGRGPQAQARPTSQSRSGVARARRRRCRQPSPLSAPAHRSFPESAPWRCR